jgi:hypothetical protein
MAHPCLVLLLEIVAEVAVEVDLIERHHQGVLSVGDRLYPLAGEQLHLSESFALARFVGEPSALDDGCSLQDEIEESLWAGDGVVRSVL